MYLHRILHATSLGSLHGASLGRMRIVHQFTPRAHLFKLLKWKSPNKHKIEAYLMLDIKIKKSGISPSPSSLTLATNEFNFKKR